MTELYRAMISSTTKDMVVHRQRAMAHQGAMMGIGYLFAGDPARALDSYDLLAQGQRDEDDVAFKLFLQPMALRQRGYLAEAERCARAALAQLDLDEDMASGAITAHNSTGVGVASSGLIGGGCRMARGLPRRERR